MSLSSLRGVQAQADRPAGWALWGLLWLGGCLAMAVASAASGVRLPGIVHQVLTALACAWLLPVVVHQTHRFAAQCSVWQGRVAPQRAWQNAWQHHRGALWLAWSTAALPLCLLRGLARPAGEDWAVSFLVMASTSALLAAVLALGLVFAAAWSGAVGWVWGGAAAVGLVALLAGGAESLASLPQAIQALSGLLTPIAALATAGLVAGMLACAPLAAVLVGRRLLSLLNEVVARPPASRLRALWQGFSERWRLIDGRAHSAVGLALMYQLPSNLTQPNADLHMLQAIGSGVSPLHGVRLLVMAALAALMLRGGVPHWRLLLAPGGQVRRWIGPRIVLGTWAWLCGLALLMPAVLGLFALLFPIPLPWSRLPGLVFSPAVPLLSDIALAAALAAWLRAWLGSPSRVFVLLLSLGGVGLSVVLALALIASVNPLTWLLWNRGPGHFLGQLGLTLLFTALAQRAWASADLSDSLRRRVADDRDEER